MVIQRKLVGRAEWMLGAFLVTAGCSSGSNDGGGGIVNPVGRPTLEESISLGFGVDATTQRTLTNDNADVTVSDAFDVRVRRNGPDATWRDADLVALSNPILDGVEVYATDRGSDFLFLSAIGTSNANLDYSAFGFWGLTNIDDVLNVRLPVQVDDAGPLAFGVRTASGDMPFTGSASYDGEAIGGEFLGRDLVSILRGTFAADADFGRGLIEGQIGLDDQDGRSWGNINTGTMDINGNRFASGSGSAFATNGQTGQVEGAFYGPSADEVAGSFRLQGGLDGTTVLGAFGGRD